MTTSELKVPLKTAINLLEQWSNDGRAMELLRSILRDLDAEPPKPTPEKAEHYSCIGCGCFPAYPGPVCESCFDRTTNPILRRNWTPEQPEPAEQKHLVCDGCKEDRGHSYHASGYRCPDWMHCVRTSSLLRCDWKSKELKSQPGLVPYPIIGGKGNELWLVQRPAGAIALYKAVGRKDFAYIETEIGDKFISLQAFDDPPIRAWFRGW